MRRGAPQRPNENGNLPLHWAVQNRHADVVRVLVENSNLKGVRREALKMKSMSAKLANRRLIALAEDLATHAEQANAEAVTADVAALSRQLNTLLNYSVRGMLVHNTLTELAEDLRVYGKTLAVCLAIRFLIVEPRFIPSLSMYPGLDVGDQLAVEKVTKLARPRDAPYRRNEVVVFNPPQSFKDIVNSRARNEALIKRVVAVAGDTVEVRGGKLYVNGRAQDEAFINEQPAYALDRMVVPAGHVFVLGDNRNQSLDGHVWGFLPTKNVIGRAVFKYWPPGRVGPVPFPEGSYA